MIVKKQGTRKLATFFISYVNVHSCENIFTTFVFSYILEMGSWHLLLLWGLSNDVGFYCGLYYVGDSLIINHSSFFRYSCNHRPGAGVIIFVWKCVWKMSVSEHKSCFFASTIMLHSFAKKTWVVLCKSMVPKITINIPMWKVCGIHCHFIIIWEICICLLVHTWT